MFRHVSCCTTVFTAEREALDETAENEADRRENADGVVARQQADDEGRDTHQGHRDKEGVLAADEIAEATEHQRAERTHREARSEAEKHEDEARSRVHAREEVGADIRGKRAGEIKVIPFENRTERRGNNDLLLFLGHRAIFRSD